MKKSIVTIWMFCYLALSVGVSVNFHYCMNKLDSTRLFASSTKICGKCGMHTDRSDGCCRDEVQVIKMEEDHQPTIAVNYDIPRVEAIVFQPSEFISASFINSDLDAAEDAIPPPLLPAQDTYLMNSVFRI